MTSKTLSDRIDALETRLMFQDETIETLNKTITEQWLKIDALTRQIALELGAEPACEGTPKRNARFHMRRNRKPAASVVCQWSETSQRAPHSQLD